MKRPTFNIQNPTSNALDVAGAKAPEDWRTPGRFANAEDHLSPRQRLGVRRPSAALPRARDFTACRTAIRHSSFVIVLLWWFASFNISFAADTNSLYLFSFFREPDGQAGLCLATSTNGLNWTELKPPNGKSFLEPQVGGKLMRDPCLRQGPDGVFHLVWTTSWGRPPVFGYASSADLVHWSEERAIPVMENDPTAVNVWAPELFYDEAKQQWLVFWATTIPGKFPETDNSGDQSQQIHYNHRIYYVTTKDFANFSPTKLLYDGGFNVIDATMLADGRQILSDRQGRNEESGEEKSAHRRWDSGEGPFGPASPSRFPPTGLKGRRRSKSAASITSTLTITQIPNTMGRLNPLT